MSLCAYRFAVASGKSMLGSGLYVPVDLGGGMARMKTALSTRDVIVIVAVGAVVLALSALFDSSDPQNKTTKTSAAAPTATGWQYPTTPAPVDQFVMPDVVGQAGYDGEKAVKSSSGYRVSPTFGDSVPVACFASPPGAAIIVRTDPVAGAEVPATRETPVVLYVDRSASALACATTTPPQPTYSEPPGNTYVNPPNVYVDPPNIPHPHKPSICKHTKWC